MTILPSIAHPFVSVIVPVHGQGASLSECLSCLVFQTYSPFEVIVVNDGGSPAIEEICRQFPRCRYVYQSHQGSFAARNTGIQQARGEILAFTDSDCQPQVQWLSQAVSLLEHEAIDLVAGHVEVSYARPMPSLIELADSILHLQQAYYVQLGYGATANLVVRRSVVDAVGQFRADLKHLGDREFGQRATGQGFRLVYGQGAIVGHPARRKARSLLGKIRRQMQARHQLEPFTWAEVGGLLGLMPLGNYRAVWRDDRCPGIGRKVCFVGLLHCIRWFTAGVMALTLSRSLIGDRTKRTSE